MNDAENGGRVRSPTVLIVDDDVAVCTTFSGILESMGQVQVLVAHTGAQGRVYALTDPPPDLMLLDLRLPDMSGLELLTDLRARRRILPTLIVSGHVDPLAEMLAADNAVVQILEKPIVPDVLLAWVQRALRRSGEDDAQAGVRRVGDLTIGLVTPRFQRGTINGELTRKEHRLLLHLAETPGRIATLSELDEAIWDGTLRGNRRPVEVVVSRLRGKIDRPSDPVSMLVTVRGEGYKLEIPALQAAN